MQPELPQDTNNAPDLKPGKPGFFDRLKTLFKKKVVPTDPPHVAQDSQSETAPADPATPATPATPEAPVAAPATPAAAPSSSVQGDEQTDQSSGLPKSSEESAPDADGETTSPELDVPSGLQTGAEAGNTEETPTLPVEEPQAAPAQGQPAPQQSTQPSVSPQQPQTPPAPQQPQSPTQNQQ